MIGFSFHDRQGKSAARASERKRGRFIVIENHAIIAWFKRGSADEEKANKK